MRLTDRYVASELLVPLLIGGGTILMMLLGNTLYARLESALREGWPLGFVLRLLVFNIPVVFIYCLPVAAAIGSALAVGRLGRDNEITVLRGVGVPLRRSLLPVFVAGALLSLLGGWIAERVVPWAWREQQNVGSLLDSLPSSPIDFSQTLNLENYVVSFEKASKTEARGFRVSDVTLIDKSADPNAPAGSWPRVLTADHADYAGELWTLSDVRLFEFEPTGEARFESAKIETGELAQHVDFHQAALNLSEEQLGNLSFRELGRLAADAARFHDVERARQYEVNRWFKFGLPLMCLPCALCGASLALRFSRGGSFAGILLSLVVVFLGWGVFAAMKFAALSGKIPAPLAASASALLFGAFGSWHLGRQE